MSTELLQTIAQVVTLVITVLGWVYTANKARSLALEQIRLNRKIEQMRTRSNRVLAQYDRVKAWYLAGRSLAYEILELDDGASYDFFYYHQYKSFQKKLDRWLKWRTYFLVYAGELDNSFKALSGTESPRNLAELLRNYASNVSALYRGPAGFIPPSNDDDYDPDEDLVDGISDDWAPPVGIDDEELWGKYKQLCKSVAEEEAKLDSIFLEYHEKFL